MAITPAGRGFAKNVHHRLARWMYRDSRPGRMARPMNTIAARLATRGLGPNRMVTLEVPGRRSGRSTSVPLVVADYEGERYLVSMLGQQAQWVHNVRAAGGRATLEDGRSENVQLVEVDAADCAPILRRYLNVAPGARAHIPVHHRSPVEDFAAVAEEYPVFRIT